MRYRSEGKISMPMNKVLMEAAVKSVENAYAPYSNFHVGAAVLSSDGEIFIGCNVENISYGLSMCAERNAVGAAITAGKKELEAIAVYTSDSPLVMPCGACRQVLAEFKIKYVIVGRPDSYKVVAVEELLPASFNEEQME